MRQLMNFLFKVDQLVFTNLAIQISMVVVFLLMLANGIGQMWIVSGLVLYVVLSVRNFFTRGVKEEWVAMVDLYRKSGAVPFLKGFTYCIMLGAFGLIAALVLQVVVLIRSR